jgi:hypothetical protein
VAKRRRLRSSSERDPAKPLIAAVHSATASRLKKAGTSVEIPFSGAAPLEDRLNFAAASLRMMNFACEARYSPSPRGKDALIAQPAGANSRRPLAPAHRLKAQFVDHPGCHFGVVKVA